MTRQPAGALLATGIIQMQTAPGQPMVWLNTSEADTAAEGAELSAVEEMVVEWSRPSARDHDDPGRLKLVLRHHQAGVVPLGALIRPYLNTNYPGQGSWVWSFGDWWVESVNWERITRMVGDRVVKLWRYEVTATDYVGRAQGQRLSSAPWPADQTLQQRLDAIETASGLMDVAGTMDGLPAGWNYSPSIRRLDVDNAPALDVVRRTADSFGLLVTSSQLGLMAYQPLGNTIEPPMILAGGTTPRVEFIPGGETFTLPASAVVQAPRELSRQGLVNEVAVGFHLETVSGDNAGQVQEVTRYYRSPNLAGRATAQTSIKTDLRITQTHDFPIDPQTAYLGRAGDRAAGLVADGDNPRPRLKATRILMDAIVDSYPLKLATVPDRATSVVVLEDAPADLDRTVAMGSATVTLAGGWVTLDASFHPTVLAGIRPLRWSDWPDPATVPANPTMGDYIAPKFTHLTSNPDPAARIRFKDTTVVASPTAWRFNA